MNRRGHLSSKVPNVKLRPAPRGSTSRSTRRDPSPDWEADDDEVPMGSRSNKPWRGIIVTFTGVEEKPMLTTLVRELGGEVESALTVKVTHVVATGYGSPKYVYAVEHRIPVMSPSWIADAHARWLQGDELDVPASIESHRLQPFLGLKIAVSGIDQLDRRKQIIKHIHLAGGVYSKDLDRSCTHLVSAFGTRDPKSKSSPKVRWAVKEIGEREALRRRGKRIDGDDIRIVYEEWIWDCVAFSGRWKEEGYDARKPRPKGKITYEEVMDGSAFIVPEKEQKEEEDDQPVVVRKRKRDTMDTLVGELLSTREVKEERKEEEPHEVSTEEAKAENQARSEPPAAEPEFDPLPARASVFERKPSLLHASRSTAFASSVPSVPAPSAANSSDRAKPAQFFAGIRVSHAIEEGCAGLDNALHLHGATLVTEEERLAGAPVDYLIVRLASATQPTVPESTTIVTDCWIEACCFRQRLIDLDSNIVYRPLGIKSPILGSEGLNVHVSGFSTEQTAYLRRLLKAVGGNLSDKFNRRTTHLMCAEPAGIKFEKALEWGIPAVRDAWLWKIVESGILEAVEPYLYEESAARLGIPSDTTHSEQSSRSLRPTLALSPSTERRLNARDTPSVSGSSPRPDKAGGSDEVTAALRRLAQGPAAAKVSVSGTVRRRTHPRREASGSGTTASPVIPLREAPVPQLEEESMRVTYADAASERERRRLLEAVMGGSPAKRARV